MPVVTVRTFGGRGLQVSAVEVAPETALGVVLAGMAGGEPASRAFSGKAVLLNGESTPAASWGELRLRDGDVISIIPMLIGG